MCNIESLTSTTLQSRWEERDTTQTTMKQWKTDDHWCCLGWSALVQIRDKVDCEPLQRDPPQNSRWDGCAPRTRIVYAKHDAHAVSLPTQRAIAAKNRHCAHFADKMPHTQSYWQSQMPDSQAHVLHPCGCGHGASWQPSLPRRGCSGHIFPDIRVSCSVAAPGTVRPKGLLSPLEPRQQTEAAL